MDNLQHTDAHDADRSGLSAVVTAPFRRQTYRNMLYLFLQFPLGILYFVTLVTLGSTGVAGFMIVTEAVPDAVASVSGGAVGVLVATVVVGVLLYVSLPLVGVGIIGAAVGGVGLFTVDRIVSEAVLGRSLPKRPLAHGDFDTTKQFVMAFLTTPGTYLASAAVLAKFPIGVATFVLLVVLSTMGVVFTTVPFLYDSPETQLQFQLTEGLSVSYVDGFYTVDLGVLLQSGTWTVDTLPEAMVVSVCGLLLLFASLNIFNGTAWLMGEATALVARYATVFDRASTE
ncbi:sensor domain-containing protein [Halorubrum halophilum]|uniref:sensor domain-containing protein n=1 Tax=Halorubrum halophilum TaxID=413816 RepID=UPI00186AEBEE|nr:sensor domain-containing protein [Halorubrum halophilum]